MSPAARSLVHYRPASWVIVAAVALASRGVAAQAKPHIDALEVTADGLLEATVRVPRGSLDNLALIDRSRDPPTEVKAIKQVAFKHSTQRLAVAIVMLGRESWIGNDREVPYLEAADPTRRSGVLIELRNTFDRLNFFKEAGPPGSLGMIITYGDRVDIRRPMGPLSAMSGHDFGSQIRYAGNTGNEMVIAIRTAVDELRWTAADRKVLIVLSDSTDTNPETARLVLPQLKQQALDARIETFAVVAKAPDSLGHDLIPLMIADPQYVSSPAGLAASIANILAHLDRTSVTFAGDELTWDGDLHQFAVRLGGAESEVYPAMLSARGRSRWGLWIGLGGVVVVTAIVLWTVRRLAGHRRGGGRCPVRR